MSHVEKCKRLAEALERAGFAVNLYTSGEPPFETCIVDFADHATEEAIKKEYPLMERIEDYATFSSRGSLAFRHEGTVDGETPVSISRPIDARGFEREEFYPPPKCAFNEVHAHVWNHQGAVHLHLKCTDPDLADLRNFIESGRSTARKFLKY